MRMRRLGASGLQVSEVGLGCNNFGSRIGREEAAAVVTAALNAGITFFDTADVYGGALSEEYLGAALGERRKSVVIATKFGLPVDECLLHRGASRRWIIEACERSLRRLGTDYVDLYQQHGPDPQTPMEETLRALDDLIAHGKVRYIGSSSFHAWQVADAHWIARSLGAAGFVSTMNLFSLLERGARTDLLPACERFGIGLLPYFPLAAGLLTGKYRRGAPAPEDARLANWGERGVQALADANLERVEALRAWAEERGRSLLELAFSWLLSHAAVSSVIAGATRPAQVADNVAAAGWRMTAEELQDLDRLLERLD